jgi:hypothetical protein
MNVNPIDLQVLFTKAVDHAAQLGREDATDEANKFDKNAKQSKDSKEANETVKARDDYDEEFTKIKEEGGNKQGMSQGGKSGKKTKSQEQSPIESYEKATLKEDGTGNIIDIVD